MRADRFKQVLKNSVYRTIGETAAAIGANGNGDRSLRVLMYHKVNDLPGNPLTMPVSIFDEQMDQLSELGYTVVDLDAVLEHYVDGTPLPERAVLITFDDGYHDNLENAAGVSAASTATPAVLFVPTRLSRRPASAAARGASRGAGHAQPHGRLGRARRARAARRAHRVARHLAPSARRPRGRRGGARDRARRSSGSRSGSAGRCVRSRTSRAPRRTTSPSTCASCARPATTSRSPRSRARTRRRPIRCSSAATTSSRTPPRTFELVLAGACDLISLKDTVTGTHARRVFNAALGTSTK